MKRLLILGAGTAGTMVANRLVHALDLSEWQITIVDQDEIHYYQPGFLFIPFGIYGKADVMRPKRDYLPRDVEVDHLPDRADRAGPEPGDAGQGRPCAHL